ncbi:MAG: hypothetical protein Q8O89_04370 [Nanoarchaeota archaeon]|nr:hypothetical protein [Nanoarchaeota archaeon]
MEPTEINVKPEANYADWINNTNPKETGNLIKFRQVRREGDTFVKKRKPGDSDVEKRMVTFFQGDPNFRVPTMRMNWPVEDELATTYVPGVQVTRLFNLLDAVNNLNKGSNPNFKPFKVSPLEVKAAIVGEILDDVHYFQSRNNELVSTLGKYCEPYPYVKKTLESFDSVVDCFKYFGFKPSFQNMSGVRKELEEIAQHLSDNARFVFRDAIIDNIMFHKPELENASNDAAISYIANQLTKSDALDQFKGRLYHIDFETSKNLVTKSDDFAHILEHQMCSLDGSDVKGKHLEMNRDELYNMTVAARIFRFWSRRCVYLVEKSKTGADRFPNERPEFYLNKVINALDALRSEDKNRFDNLYKFCLDMKNIDYSNIIPLKE